MLKKKQKKKPEKKIVFGIQFEFQNLFFVLLNIECIFIFHFCFL